MAHTRHVKASYPATWSCRKTPHVTRICDTLTNIYIYIYIYIYIHQNCTNQKICEYICIYIYIDVKMHFYIHVKPPALPTPCNSCFSTGSVEEPPFSWGAAKALKIQCTYLNACFWKSLEERTSPIQIIVL